MKETVSHYTPLTADKKKAFVVRIYMFMQRQRKREREKEIMILVSGTEGACPRSLFLTRPCRTCILESDFLLFFSASFCFLLVSVCARRKEHEVNARRLLLVYLTPVPDADPCFYGPHQGSTQTQDHYRSRICNTKVNKILPLPTEESRCRSVGQWSWKMPLFCTWWLPHPWPLFIQFYLTKNVIFFDALFALLDTDSDLQSCTLLLTYVLLFFYVGNRRWYCFRTLGKSGSLDV